MPVWIIAVALASIAATVVLTGILWRLNEKHLRGRDGGDAGSAPYVWGDADGGGDGGGD
jgi:hypothetical protein